MKKKILFLAHIMVILLCSEFAFSATTFQSGDAYLLYGWTVNNDRNDRIYKVDSANNETLMYTMPDNTFYMDRYTGNSRITFGYKNGYVDRMFVGTHDYIYEFGYEEDNLVMKNSWDINSAGSLLNSSSYVYDIECDIYDGTSNYIYLGCSSLKTGTQGIIRIDLNSSDVSNPDMEVVFTLDDYNNYEAATTFQPQALAFNIPTPGFTGELFVGDASLRNLFKISGDGDNYDSLVKYSTEYYFREMEFSVNYNTELGHITNNMLYVHSNHGIVPYLDIYNTVTDPGSYSVVKMYGYSAPKNGYIAVEPLPISSSNQIYTNYQSGSKYLTNNGTSTALDGLYTDSSHSTNWLYSMDVAFVPYGWEGFPSIPDEPENTIPEPLSIILLSLGLATYCKRIDRRILNAN